MKKSLPKRVIDLTGKKFGKLTVLEYAGLSIHNTSRWKCICECGTEKEIEGQSLRTSNTTSCGCLYREKADNLPPINRSRKFAPIVCGVYKIINPLEEVYIGGSKTIYRRWLRHREARKKLKIHLSIKQFGWKNHRFEILHQLPHDVSNDILISYEQFYIDTHKACGMQMLNVKDAGSRAKFADESKRKMSESHKGKVPWNKGKKGLQVAWNKGLKNKNI